MHVCLLSDGYPPWERGGAQKIAAQLARGYAERGHRVSVITTVDAPSDVGRTVLDGVEAYRIYSPRWPTLLPYLSVFNPFVAPECGRLLDLLDPDVVHAQNVHRLSNRSLRLAAERGIPVVKTYHDAGTVSYGELTHFVERHPTEGKRRIPADRYRVNPWRQFREQGARYFPLRNRLNRRHLGRDVSVGVAVSDELRRALEANGVPCRETIHNGVDASEFAADGAAFRRKHDLDGTRFVLFGGRTGYNKGGRHLARAFRRVADAVDAPVRLVVTGDRDYVPEMRDASGGRGDEIVATGWLPRSELRAALSAATVVATPSVFLDPFPTTNLEAFAAGTPVVTTWFGGAKELVSHGEDGFVVNPRDVEALSAALRRFLASPERASAYGAAGRRKVEREFTVEGTVDDYLGVLRRATE
ncbi:glycosyltransferase family 4 protein [Haladaptatus salinisoli]|uniref:glycosyltransferase family 4 protein n=1 Tax=Haladaptatus salinisoli TaxID=2884876 RepID=UPI001D0A0F08|nr:glycosyltransferase family 4 protein [Haladaptatus salinisoli]